MLFPPFIRSITLTLLLAATFARAETVQGRYTAGCALVETTVYCYGGQNSPTVTNFTFLQENLFNSFSVANDMTLDDMQNNWTSIQRDHLGPLYFFTMTPVPDQKSILVDGGGVREAEGYRPKYTTTMYDVTTQNWATDLIDGHPTVSLHTSILGADDTVYIWGGVHYPLNYIAQNLSLTHPLDMFLFDLSKKRWTKSNSPSFLQNNRGRNAAVLGQDNTTIYYIGGMIPDSPSNPQGTEYYYNPAPMNQIITFNTSDLSWSNWNTTGNVTPTTRSGHTLTLNPITNEIILLGGYDPFSQDNNYHRADYCYSLDTTAREWHQINIAADPGASQTAEGIFGHSVVTVGKYLFVIFGSVPPVGAPTSNIRAINMETMTWAASFTAPPPPPSPTEASDSNESSSSNAGTIAGAVVGAVVGVGLIAGLLAFFFIRRRRQSKTSEKDLSSPERDHMVPPPPAYAPSSPRQSEDVYSSLPRPTSPFSQPQSPATHSQSVTQVPLSSVGSSSEGTASQSMSYFYGTEKPDAAPSGVQRIVMTPVKPDGA